MNHACSRPCPFVQRHRYDLIRLRDHLAEGHRCADAWIAIAHLVREPWQRLDCLERACAIDPNDQNLRIARLEHYVVLHPEDAQAAEELRETKARRALERYKPRVFRHQDASQPIGAILRALRAISDTDLEVVLEEQDHLRRLGRPLLLGDLLVRRGRVAPETLARALTLLHLQETFSDVVKTDKTGLSKTAHTRWMISAFANFLPGSTIFRLA